MKKLPFWIRSLLFLLVFGALCLIVEHIIAEDYNSDVYAVEKMIREQDQFDIVIMASSMGYNSFDPKIMNDVLVDSTTTNLSITNLSFAHASLLLQQLIDEGKTPEIVVLEMFSLSSPLQEHSQTEFFHYFSNTWKPAYLKQILSFYDIEHLPYALFPLLYQHENWKKTNTLNENANLLPERQSALDDAMLYHPGYQHDGFRPSNRVIPDDEFHTAVNQPLSFLPTEANIKALKQILELSETHNFRVVFVEAPYPQQPNPYSGEIEAVMESFNQQVYNLETLQNEPFMQHDFRDNPHFNAHGAIQASLSLATILAEEAGRELDQELVEQYNQLRIRSISVTEIDHQLQISLQSALSNPDWKVNWAIETAQGQELFAATTKENNPTLLFPLPATPLDETFLHISINQTGLNYPLYLVFNLADMVN